MEIIEDGSRRSGPGGAIHRQRESDTGSAFQSLADVDRVWRWVVTVEGNGRHASTTADDRCRDALLCATRFIEVVNRAARAEPAGMTWSVRRVQQPGSNGDRTLDLVLEIRSPDSARAEGLFDRIFAEGRLMGRLGGTTFSFASAGNVPVNADRHRYPGLQSLSSMVPALSSDAA